MRCDPRLFRHIMLCLPVLLSSGCISPILTQEFDNIEKYYQSHDKPAAQWDTLDKVKLLSIEGGQADKPAVVFVHGTPGSWSFFTSYINHPQLQQQARLIAIDRPGWGESTITGDYQPTLTAQSQMLGQWLCKTAAASPGGKLILVGHSYGATLAPRLALDHPDCISAMLLLNGAADPDLAAPRWYNHLTGLAPIGWLVDQLSSDLFQANKEMMPIQAELEKMRDSWTRLKLPVVVFHGGEDLLVNPDHSRFIEKKLAHLPAKVIRMPDEGHFILFSHRQRVVNEILQLLGSAAGKEQLPRDVLSW